MAQKETEIRNKILSTLSDNKRLFRINAGRGWTGSRLNFVDRKTLIIKNPRPLIAAPTGWPDLSGWTTVEITPEMVGQKVAVFTGNEIKTGKQQLNQKQKMFADLLKDMGGLFEVVRNC